jgi:hypothetical protein
MADGANAKAVRATLKQLEVNPVTDARGRLALTLAQALDGDAGMATAAVARELRATLAELEGRNDGNTDDLASLLAGLSTPVEHTKN